ncbi:conserved protein, unknown function [Hepatocystis sp. ex Piliocolobus tephrosceles]|nr:conserved protein, unknown function [Hepatocystis sp. ex Piliocolobus tephrosceles]
MAIIKNESLNACKKIMQNVLDNVCEGDIDKCYFLVEQAKPDYENFSLCKLKFRNELMLKLDDNEFKEQESFNLVFNNLEIINKKNKKAAKEHDYIEKIKFSDAYRNDNNNVISDNKLTEILNNLIKCNKNKINEHIIKENNLHLLHNSYSFYDDMNSTNLYIIDTHNDFQISTLLNGLLILSLSKYSNIFFNILKNLKNTNSKDVKQLINDNVTIKYDERLLNADTSGKRKKNTIYISEQMVILKILYKDQEYKIKSKINGWQVDINENIVKNPHLLFTDTQEAWIVIVKKKNNILPNTLTSIQYQHERAEFMQQYDTLLNSF